MENQKYAPRLTVLERLPASVRFVSAEPLLERIDLRPWLDRGVLHWVIAGGESGPRARPMDPDWARDLRDQSVDAGVAFFPEAARRRSETNAEEQKQSSARARRAGSGEKCLSRPDSVDLDQ